MLFYLSLLNCFLALLMLVFNRRVNRNVIFLSLLILLVSVYTITYYIIAIEQSRYWAALFYANLAPLWYLPGPFLYWYIRGNLEDRIRLRKSDWLHLIPFAISLVGIFPYLGTSFQHKLETVDALFLDPNIPKFDPPNWLLPVEWNLLLRPALLMAYSIFCMWMVWKAQGTFSRSSAVAQDQWVFLRNWMILLSGILFLISVPPLFLSYFYSFQIHIDFSTINAYSMSSATAYSQTLISIILLIFPQILYGIPRSTSRRILLQDPSDSTRVENGPDSHLDNFEGAGNETKESRQDEDPFVELGQRVLRFMEEKKPYVDPDFTLEVMARSMDVPKHHLYYCFQNIMNTKFTRLRTEYRIEHAKKLLAEEDLTKTTLNILGKESGFASTSAFYTTFKAEVGCSPGEYAARVNPSYPG
jgi:AraC-like DNA-binding protein